MIRTQIQLTEDQAASLKAIASRRGVSIAELIRQCADRLIATSGEPSQKELRQRAASIAGRFRSGQADISVRHDDYLAKSLKE